MTRQPLWVILCHLPEKGRKQIEEIVVEMRERDREKKRIRNESKETDRRDSSEDEREGQGKKRIRNESKETGEIKTFPLYPYLLQG